MVCEILAEWAARPRTLNKRQIPRSGAPAKIIGGNKPALPAKREGAAGKLAKVVCLNVMRTKVHS